MNSDAWIVGEIWGDAHSWLQGQHFDGVMNYRIGWSTLGWTGNDALREGYQNPEYPLQARSTEELINIWSSTTGSYRPEVNRAQMNLLDSHDVPRALHSLNGDLNAMKLALLLLFLQPELSALLRHRNRSRWRSRFRTFQRARTSLPRSVSMGPTLECRSQVLPQGISRPQTHLSRLAAGKSALESVWDRWVGCRG